MEILSRAVFPVFPEALWILVAGMNSFITMVDNSFYSKVEDYTCKCHLKVVKLNSKYLFLNIEILMMKGF